MFVCELTGCVTVCLQIDSLFVCLHGVRVCVCVLIDRLCVAALALDSFCGSREALYGVFDGERNVEVPYLLQCTMGDVLAEELHKSQRRENYMTNTFSPCRGTRLLQWYPSFTPNAV